jgi:hypothetical protein
LEVLEDRLVPSALVAGYPDGVWRYDTTTGWAHISNLDAYRLVADASGNIFGQFSDGVWRWTAATASWAHLTTLSEDLDSYRVTPGGVLYADFHFHGLWRWSFAGWQKLSDLDPVRMAVSDSDAFFGSFDAGWTTGTWRWTPASGWSILTLNRPDMLWADAAGEVVGVYNQFMLGSQAGTWRWNPTSGWARLTTAAPKAAYLGNDGSIFEDRSANGIWRLAPGANSFTQISTSNTHTYTHMVAQPDGNLFLMLDNGKGASPQFNGWYWNASTGWSLLPSSSAIGDLCPDKVDDLFYARQNLGTWMWSASGGALQISGDQLLAFCASG